MMTENLPQIELGDAGEADLISLTGLLSRIPLRDYFRLAKQSTLRCLTLRRAGQIIGFGLLVFRRPEFWPAARDDLHRLPEMVGMSVKPAFERRGYGSAFMHGIEVETTKAGYRRFYLTVDPIENPVAYASIAASTISNFQSSLTERLGSEGLAAPGLSRRKLAR